MRCSIDWQDDGVNAVPEECATVCDLSLFLNEQNVTRYTIGDKVGDCVTIALYGLINGLVHDWWMIFGARDKQISLRNYRTGYLIPDVRIQFDGAAFEISAIQCGYTDPDLRFWGGPTEVLSRDEGEACLSSFVEEVLARLEAQNIRETSAAMRWSRIQSSYKTETSTFCEAVGSLGLDPYQVSDDIAEFIEKAETVFDRESLIEFVSGSEQVNHTRLIDWVMRMANMKSLKYRLTELRSIVDKIGEAVPRRNGEPAWSAGYRRARAIRKELNIKSHHRFGSFIDLARAFGASKNYNLAAKVDGISALRREDHNHIHVHIRNHGDFEGSSAAHLFSLARAIGDAACFPEPQTSPVNRLHRAYRQAAGRAFAAEFLAPIEEIQSMREDERDEISIAHELGVSPMVVEHQIENEERITEACA